MSFACCVEDVLALIQLSWGAVEGARRACGKTDDLTKEVSSLYDVLAHFYAEMSVPESPIGQARRSLRTEFQNNLKGCERELRIIGSVLNKFNTLRPEQRNGKPLWSKVQFANGGGEDLVVIRSRLSTYATTISMSFRLMSLRSRGKIERQLSRQKASFDGLRESINYSLALLSSTTKHKSLIAAYSSDSKGFWRSLRRELVNNGFKKGVIQSKKNLIISYFKELDSRGVLGYSTAYQKSLAREIELRQPSRQTQTPESFRSDSTFTDGRTSNASRNSFTTSKFAARQSPFFDEAVCLQTPTWPESRSPTAVGSAGSPSPRTSFVDEGYSGSPKVSPPCRGPYASTVSQDLYDEYEALDMLPESQIFGSMPPLERFPRNPSTLSMAEQKIKFEDPQGREFSFPFSQAKNWDGLQALMKKNCAGLGDVNAREGGTNVLPYLWGEMASPGAKLTLRRPAPLAQPEMYIPPSEDFFLLPEQAPTPEEEEFRNLPTLGDWISRGITEFTPHSEFVAMD